MCGEILSCSKTYYNKDGSVGTFPTHKDSCKLVYCRKCAGINRSGKNHPMWKAARTRNKDGYIVVTISRNKLEYEHRLVMEKYIGRKIKPNEHIHHVNGIKDDNRIENLVLMDKHEHASTTFVGRTHTAETKQRLSLSKMGTKNPRYGKPAWNRKVL